MVLISYSEHRNFTEQKVSSETMPSIRTPQSSAFVDFDNDLTAGTVVFQKWTPAYKACWLYSILIIMNTVKQKITCLFV